MAFGRRSRGTPRSSEPIETPNTPIRMGRLFQYLKPYALRMIIALLALLGYTATGLIFPLVIVNLLKAVLTPPFNPDLLNTVAIGLVVIFLISSVLAFVQSYLLAYVGENILVNLRTALHSLAVTLAGFLRQSADR